MVPHKLFNICVTGILKFLSANSNILIICRIPLFIVPFLAYGSFISANFYGSEFDYRLELLDM